MGIIFQFGRRKRAKTGWILGHHLKPATSDPTYPQWDIDNCTILGWLFNSIEDRIYHMFIYNDTVHSPWTALIPLGGTGTILNIYPLPSLYEAFAIIDGDECRHRLIQTSPALSSGSTHITDQMAFAASGSGPRSPMVSQLGLLQSQLGSLLQQQPPSSTATIAIGTPSLPGPDAETIPIDLDELPRPIHLFDSPLVQVPPASATRAPLKVYTHRTPPSAPLPDSSSVFGTSPSHLAPSSVSPRYPCRTRHPLIVLVSLAILIILLPSICLMSYQGLSASSKVHPGPLPRYGYDGMPSASTPMDPNLKLSTESGELLLDASVYQRLVGRLIYLTNTRLDITFAVSVVSQFMHAPRTSHLDAVHHILRCLKTCPGLGLFYTTKAQDGVSCFTDADYAGSKSDRRSTSGPCTFYGNHLLSWKK
ncbi:hypothetical protein Acr_06g0008680 [Actinidia rufa]|uniref:Uncharacterized protein n=1 Tax=Actinidia rufa TaxID=165716 RepID=A0A7J0ER01_9ERIC|nr:hypothetical protein Acr_06g0008680 [Actinidia rufa]